MKSRRVITHRWLCLALALLPARFAVAAEPAAAVRDFAVRTWGREEGLPGDSVTAILETRDGFLWIGTTERLARFDGVKFTEFPLTPAGTNASTHITALCEDANGKLWVGTLEDGIVCLTAPGHKSYRKASGLLNDEVTSLAADGAGRVWIGTRTGLNRWDGKAFTAYTSRDGLADEWVKAVHVARSGAVWITTPSGMYQIKEESGATGQVRPYEFETDSQGRRPQFLGAYEDRRGNLWAFGDTYLINLAGGERYNYFRGVDAAAMRIWSLCEGRDGRLWVGTSGRGLVCFDDNEFQPVTVNEVNWPNDVRAICEDREGSLWLGTRGGGLMQLVPQPVQVLRADQGLPPGAATCLAADAGGRIYAAYASGGLFAGEGDRFERFPAAGGVEGQDLASSLAVASDGTLWVATLGNGLMAFRNGRRLQLTTANGLSDNSLPAICANADGVWAGTRAGQLHCVTDGDIRTFAAEHGLPGTPITALLPARSGDGGLWVGTEDGQVLRMSSTFHVPGSNPSAATFAIVHRFTESSGRAVLALHEDARGRLWMGAAGAGLACWTGQRSLSWTTQNGLPDDVIYGVIEDADGDLWLSVGRGIFRASRELLQEALATGEPWRNKIMFEIKGPAEQIMASGWPRALQVIQGKLWFATAAGLIAADKRRPEQAVTASPPVYLENVVVNGKAVSGLGSASDLGSGVSGLGSNALPETRDPRPETQTLRLPVDLESLEFHFTAPSFVAPEKLQFRHWLEGADRDWVVDGTERRVRYGRLPSGDYRFRVAASLVDGVWNEAAESFAFTVPTPLWRTPAALAFYVLIAVGTVAGVVRVVSTRRLRQHLERLEGQRVVERERMRIAQDMHDDIGSKLTKISFLSERAKQSFKFQVPGSKLNNSALQEASGVGNLEPGTRNLEQETFGQIESIATTSRELLQTLDEIVWAVNPRNDSLEHLAAYLSHYAAEYFQNTSVQCDLRMPRDLPHQPLSAELRHNLFLAFEEVLNNVLKHSGATSVNVEMTLMRTKFQIVIADNGCGFNVAATRAERPANSTRRGGNGLVNLQQRLSVVGGDCVVTSQPGHGTTVTLRIPLASTAKVKL